MWLKSEPRLSCRGTKACGKRVMLESGEAPKQQVEMVSETGQWERACLNVVPSGGKSEPHEQQWGIGKHHIFKLLLGIKRVTFFKDYFIVVITAETSL